MIQFSSLHACLLRSGAVIRAQVYIYSGPCLIGQPTAYVVHNGTTIWVIPGESVAFVEAPCQE